ncbi:hypothetical protein ACIA8C_08390 [Nocardia sp. NPDC051321]|uniref:hypothetical protein n=1 Tax=Nocardia sp. NPDC051321 TaxID=3364323 RepID=UPI00379E98F9
MTRTVRWVLGIGAVVVVLAAGVIVLSPHSDDSSPIATTTSAVDPLQKQVNTPSGTPKITTRTPFDAQGAPTAGWEVDDKVGSGPIDCSYDEASPSATTDNILACSPSAAAADSCVAVANKPAALCLIDPFSTRLTRYATSTVRTTGVHAPQAPTPIGLVLDDGTTCRLRNGGSWSRQEANPDYIGYYSCRGTGFQAIWGPPDGPAITQQPDGWTVQFGSDRGPLTQHRVTEALYVAIQR